jgi:hypothetical protein
MSSGSRATRQNLKRDHPFPSNYLKPLLFLRVTAGLCLRAPKRSPFWNLFCVRWAIAILQLLYTEAIAAEWLFPQEKATLHDLKTATSIGEPLWTTHRCAKRC